jgi:hypothetical protein
MSDVAVEAVFEVSEAISYEWTHLAVYRHPSYPDMFTTACSSGCSCDGWEPPTADELRAGEPLPRPEVRRKLLSYMDTNKSWFSPGATVRYLEEFEIAMNEAAK